MSDSLADLAQWATEVVYSFGYIGVFVLTTLANLHLPLPSELFLPLAGFLVGRGASRSLWCWRLRRRGE